MAPRGAAVREISSGANVNLNSNGKATHLASGVQGNGAHSDSNGGGNSGLPSGLPGGPTQAAAATGGSRKRPRLSAPTIPTRTLRHRASLPAPLVSAATIEEVKQQLGPEGLSSFREQRIKEREGDVRSVVDVHDGLVRERFHLERFVSILEGWDPKVN